MKHVKLFEQFVTEAKKRTSPPSGYADEAFWDKIFPDGISEPFVDRPKFRSVTQSISYDLGLGFGGSGNNTPTDISDYGTKITDGEGSETVVKGAFVGDYSYAELRAAVEAWAKKKGLINEMINLKDAPDYVQDMFTKGDYIEISSSTSLGKGDEIVGIDNGVFYQIHKDSGNKVVIIDDAWGDKQSISRKNLEKSWLIKKK